MPWFDPSSLPLTVDSVPVIPFRLENCFSFAFLATEAFPEINGEKKLLTIGTSLPEQFQVLVAVGASLVPKITHRFPFFP